jgi:hypothetical protein
MITYELTENESSKLAGAIYDKMPFMVAEEIIDILTKMIEEKYIINN